MAALHRQLTGHLKYAGFTLVVAYAGGTLAGFGYAFPCSADYWFGAGLVDQVPAGARTERLMGLCELAGLKGVFIAVRWLTWGFAVVCVWA
ncbi:hypothetical protein AB0P37_43905 [Streptomyces antimycoticus]|uniref:hypothetical protein n=1 Tax=Streptomyces antimycoticus TaxID=68175 RepID=UPI00341496AD